MLNPRKQFQVLTFPARLTPKLTQPPVGLVHVDGAAFMMRAVMAIMKPFMKKKLRDRIRNLRTPEVIESLNLPPALTPT